NGNGDYTSASYTANVAGTYHWVAVYSGDLNNNGIATACDDASEQVTVSKASPAITTNVSATEAAGGQVDDTAQLTCDTYPVGIISFTLSSDADCTAFPTRRSTDLNGNGDYTSASYTANVAGTYHWVAVYSSDANNNGAATACDDASEQVTVSKA